MNKKERIIQELDDLPDDKLQSVLNFIRELKSEEKEERIGPAMVSETSLAKDWLKKEEDEAWRDL
jgi:hypothetical protein